MRKIYHVKMTELFRRASVIRLPDVLRRRGWRFINQALRHKDPNNDCDMTLTCHLTTPKEKEDKEQQG